MVALLEQADRTNGHAGPVVANPSPDRRFRPECRVALAVEGQPVDQGGPLGRPVDRHRNRRHREPLAGVVRGVADDHTRRTRRAGHHLADGPGVDTLRQADHGRRARRVDPPEDHGPAPRIHRSQGRRPETRPAGRSRHVRLDRSDPEYAHVVVRPGRAGDQPDVGSWPGDQGRIDDGRLLDGERPPVTVNGHAWTDVDGTAGGSGRQA